MIPFTTRAHEGDRNHCVFSATALPPDEPAHWYLIDLAAQPDGLKTLYRVDPDPLYALPYIGTPYHAAAMQGPALIKPVSKQAEAWLQQMLDESQAMALYGDQLTMSDVSSHLATLSQVEGPYGRQLFRYASPRGLGSLGPSLTNTQSRRLLGPLQAMRARIDGQHWCLIRQSPCSADVTLAPLMLTTDNLQHVARARQRSLADALAASYQLERRTVQAWFDQFIQLGAPSEQALVEASRILARQALNTPIPKTQLQTITHQQDTWPQRLDALAALADKPEEGTS